MPTGTPAAENTERGDASLAIILCLVAVGVIPVIAAAAGSHDPLFTMIGHVAIFATTLLTYAQARANGKKLGQK